MECSEKTHRPRVLVAVSPHMHLSCWVKAILSRHKKRKCDGAVLEHVDNAADERLEVGEVRIPEPPGVAGTTANRGERWRSRAEVEGVSVEGHRVRREEGRDAKDTPAFPLRPLTLSPALGSSSLFAGTMSSPPSGKPSNSSSAVYP